MNDLQRSMTRPRKHEQPAVAPHYLARVLSRKSGVHAGPPCRQHGYRIFSQGQSLAALREPARQMYAADAEGSEVADGHIND